MEMDKWVLNVYMEELCNQAQAALIAVEALNKATENPPEDFPRAFAAAQGLLGAGAAMSRLLWPSDPPKSSASEDLKRQKRATQRRGRLLRAELGVGDLPALKQRKVRDAFEHFDERLDRTFEGLGDQRIVDRHIGRTPPSGPGMEEPKYLRVITPDKTISVLGTEVSCQELFDAIGHVATSAASWVRKHGPGTESFEADRQLPMASRVGSSEEGGHEAIEEAREPAGDG